MIEPFMKGSGFLHLPLGEKENENVLFIYLLKKKKKNSLVYVFYSSDEKYFTKSSAVLSIFISQTFTSWNTAVPFSLKTFDLPQTLQLKSLIT